jgi:hypothetical protein
MNNMLLFNATCCITKHKNDALSWRLDFKLSLSCNKISTNFTDFQCTNVSSYFWSRAGGGRSGPSHEGAGAGAGEGAGEGAFFSFILVIFFFKRQG